MKLLRLFSSLLIGVIFLLPVDSYAQKLRVESQDGQKYVIHKVQKGETVYSLAKSYDVKQGDITRLNPEAVKVLKEGTEVRIPYTPDVKNPKLTAPAEEYDKHTVQKGEWLSQIARKYDVELEDLREWNRLESETIKPGQELIVGVASSRSKGSKKPSTNKTMAKKTSPNKTNQNSKITLKTGVYKDQIHIVKKGESLASLKRQYGVSMADIREWNNLKDDNLKIDQKIIIHKTPQENTGDNTQVANNSTNTTNANTNTNTNNSVNNNPNTNTGDPFGGNNTGNNNTAVNNTNTGDPFGNVNTTNGNQNTNTNTGNPFGTNNTNTQNTNSGNNGVFQSPNTNINQNNSQNQYTYTPPQMVGQYSKPISHKVTSGQTINQISSKYNVARSEIRYWNNLPNNDLIVNQKLNIYLPYRTYHQAKSGESAKSIGDYYKVQDLQINIWNNLRTKDGVVPVKPGQNLVLYLPTGPRPKGQPNPPNVGQYNNNNTNQNNNNQNNWVNNNANNQNNWTNTNNNNQNNWTNSNTNNQNNNNTYQTQNPNVVNNNAQSITHIVGYNESIMSIAEKYNVDDPTKIADWNNLGNNFNVQQGQKLIIYPNNYTGNTNNQNNFNNTNNQQNTNNNNPVYNNPYSGNPYNRNNPYSQGGYPGLNTNNNNGGFGSQTDAGNNNGLSRGGNSGYQSVTGGNTRFQNNNITGGNTRFQNNNTTGFKSTNNTNTFSRNSGDTKTIRENGYAELIRNIQDPKPFVALHRSAPTGTLLTIKNKANGKSVVATVVGPLDNAQGGTLVQITDASYRRLASIQQKFPVEITYISRKKK